MSAVVFVEGDSDRAAIETLAARRGQDLTAEGVSIVSMGGASSLADFLHDAMGSAQPATTLAGLCDEAEAVLFSRALEQAGLGSNLTVPEMESLGFFVCVRDLEDELIRALGPDLIEQILMEQGELRKFRIFQNQPHWRGQPPDEQFRRFAGIRSGRKIRYGQVLVQALDLSNVPRPLDRLLAFVLPPDRSRA